MADSAYLEKMGRELKCPICLSLLNSAVSLTCNHVFCNSCILTSMKSASNCPVCKVPYSRREVRAAPHMDNLVSIYKSMELASGINIFATQNAPSAGKPEDEQIHGDGGSNSGARSGKTCDEITVKQGRERKGLKEIETTYVRLSESHQTPKPTFPVKRRVRVPKFSLYETTAWAEKDSNVENQSAKIEVERKVGMTMGSKSQKKNDSSILKEKPAFDDKGDPVFKPFFWLRERDDDSEEASEDLSAQLMEDDCSKGTSQRNAPCFSDIKDSDNGSTIKMTPTGEVSSEPKAADVFESEMFEWTQRACSPELCLTPMKTQEDHGTATKINTAFRNDAAECMNEQENENINKESPILSSKQNKSGSAKNRKKKTIKRRRPNSKGGAKSSTVRPATVPDELAREVPTSPIKVPEIFNQENRCTDNVEAVISESKLSKQHRKKTIKKRKRPNSKVEKLSTVLSAIVSDELAGEVPTSPMKVAEVFNQENKCTENAEAVISESKLMKKHKKRKCIEVLMNQTNGTSADEGLQEGPKKSSEVKCLNQGKENVGMMELPVLPHQQNENDKSLDGENKTSKLKTRRCVSQSKNLNISTSMPRVLKEIPQNYGRRRKNQQNTNMNKELPVLPCPQAGNDETMESGKKTGDKFKKINSQYKRNNTRESKELKRLKKCSGNATENEAIDEGLLDTNRSDGKKSTIISKHQEELAFEGDNNSAKNEVLPIAKDHDLQKCENVPSNIQCAFCQSGNDSKISGVMLHYFHGKPVAADYNRGSNVIHSHSNCTEWAPNVYFEDDTVMNLEAEITRSKRIKCSCCGVKGASLGCYEKSCRKSFHVPCAKLVPECRWDTENFVMLCPLHISSKLPKEIIGFQQKRRNRSAPKMDSQANTTIHPDVQKSGNWKWPSVLPSKWVICCSALTAAEKEIVSNFTRMVGASLSKTWIPTVTHVIASTDENGACKRTLKYLMGILEGKWILKIDWIKACMAAMEPVSEEQFEIGIDIHGVNNSPRFGRLRVMNKEPKLFNGLTFYFGGDFESSYKGDLQSLVIAGGGNVLQRKPISRDRERLLNESFASTTFIIYNLEPPEKCDSSKKDLILDRRRAEAHTLANATGAKVAAHSWILDSIAACKLQKLT